jgi:ElaB/YqjD/DUF883 family membrane-anchored ribosome-binding protein
MSTVRDQIGQQAMEMMHDLEEMRESTADPAGDKFEPETEFDYCEQAPDKVLDGVCSAQQLIREQPVKSVLIALSSGVLLGGFWTIRRR